MAEYITKGQAWGIAQQILHQQYKVNGLNLTMALIFARCVERNGY